MPKDVKWCGSCGEGTVKADRPDCKKCGAETWVNSKKKANALAKAPKKNPVVREMSALQSSSDDSSDEETFEDEPKTLAEIQAEKRAEMARKQKAAASAKGNAQTDASKRQQAQRAANAMAKSPVTHGSCFEDGSSQQPFCVCDDGWRGSKCDNPFPRCQNGICVG